MKLGQIDGRFGLTVVRDAELASLGLLSHNAPAMLAYAEAAPYVARLAQQSNLAAVVTTPLLAASVPAILGLAVSDTPRQSFFALHSHLAAETSFYWRDFATEIAPDAYVHPAAYVAPRNVRLGSGVVVEPRATVLERSILGEGVILRAGCTIGSEGFQFSRAGDRVLSVAHAGGVRLCDRVEIQANAVVARALFGGFTEIGADTKLDNLVQVAHHVRVGRRCLIGACATIAGSTVLGDDVWVGPNATISGELVIGDGAQVSLGSVVVRDVSPGQRVSGNFAIAHERFIAFMRSLKQ